MSNEQPAMSDKWKVKSGKWKAGMRAALHFSLFTFHFSLSTLLLLIVSPPCGAAEIELRSECQANGLVRLGDVAEIHTHDTAELAQLKAMELFPAPAVGGKSFVRAREVQDLLALRGVKLSQHRLTGSSQIEIHNGVKAAGPLSSSAVTRATQRVEAAIAASLRRSAGEDGAWNVEPQLEDQQIQLISATRETITAEGGQAPFSGEQQFTITVPGKTGQQQFAVSAKVTAVPLVAVATRALVPGDIVQRTDVKLDQAKARDDDILFHSLDEVIGQQARRAVVEGQPIKQEDVQSPVLVHRGDAVVVFARSAGIQVKTQGRAQEEGSRGDVIVVQSLTGPERFMARVSGIHEVEVFAQTADADAATVPTERISQALKPANRKPGWGKKAGTTGSLGFRLPGSSAPRQAAVPNDDLRPLTTERRQREVTR
ncbi:MAG TPA: flagellar basal body P-ring formation chaperone FlgA [Pirellulales bacterium]|nr:flagellar basal body P-ring formation chaperone FlgA [Pirellulales bacterium]